MKAVKAVASRLEITEEQAAELLSQIRVHGWEWTPRESKGLAYEDSGWS
jgi:hypothetical protein